MDNKEETTEADQADSECCNGTKMLHKDGSHNNQFVSNKARFGGYVTESLVIFCATLPSLNIGYAIGFSSPATRDFEVYETQLKLTTEQTTWFGSLLVLFAIAGSMACGLFMDKFGRKLSILLQLLIYTSGWVSLSVAGSCLPLFIGRCLTGFAMGASFTVIPVYLVEIGPSIIRGSMGTLFNLILAVGILVPYALGFHFRWRSLSYIGVILASTSFLLCLWIPESPSWLVKKGRRERARKSLRFLQGRRKSRKEISNEVDTIAESILHHETGMHLRDALEPSFCKPLLILIFLNVFQHLSGVNVIIFYAHSIFRMANFQNESVPSLLVSGIQVFALFVPLALMDRLGRRKLAFISGIGATLCNAAMGICFMKMEKDLFATLRDNITSYNASGSAIHEVTSHPPVAAWLTLVSALLFIVFFAFGLGPIPFVVLAELMPLKTRGVGGGIVSATNWLMCFLVVKCFPSFVDLIHIYGVFWLLSGLSATYVVFCWWCLPETMGRSRDELGHLFDRRHEVVARKQNSKDDESTSLTTV
uniref:solute carrier family 2, facilitated glucose transporter member 8 n=1 Tax=Ciona intestinalis TaxID=7719 RepID=UPI00006A5CED|nr:solute carrier family 2, facilitated glucose transporter member 8 [Ciona intestinalis]|eukprot:XP_002130730.1 solute carrier family 2, facilitated glucose transporter member 8 [Ciona intestinalis]